MSAYYKIVPVVSVNMVESESPLMLRVEVDENNTVGILDFIVPFYVNTYLIVKECAPDEFSVRVERREHWKRPAVTLLRFGMPFAQARAALEADKFRGRVRGRTFLNDAGEPVKLPDLARGLIKVPFYSVEQAARFMGW